MEGSEVMEQKQMALGLKDEMVHLLEAEGTRLSALKKATPRFRNYWKDGVFFTGGHAWRVTEGLRTVCLGTEKAVIQNLVGESGGRREDS